MVEADQRVPVAAVLGNREIEIRSCREGPGPVRVVNLPLEAEEEVGLVPDDRTADHAAPIASDRGGLDQILRSDEIVLRRQFVAGRFREEHALELVRPRFGDRVDDRAAGAAELRIVHAGQHLEFLDRFERGADLRARTGTEGVVGVVAAVHRDVVVLRRGAACDDRVVAHLVGRRKLDAREHGDRRKVVAVHRRQLAQLGGPDVAADFHARRVHERRFGRHSHCFLERAEHHRHIDGQRLADRQHKAAALEVPEARELGRNAVTPWNELRREVATVRAGRHLTEDPGLLVGDDDRHAGKRAALFVGRLSADFGCALLSEERRGCREKERRENRSDGNSAHLSPPFGCLGYEKSARRTE